MFNTWNEYKSKNIYKNDVLDHVFDIVCQVSNISEKDYNRLDKLKQEYTKIVDDNLSSISKCISMCESDDKRYQYTAEKIFHDFFKYDSIDEKLSFEKIDKPRNFKTKLNGVGLGKDKNGYFVYTHRARSKSYDCVENIPMKDINFIKSTG